VMLGSLKPIMYVCRIGESIYIATNQRSEPTTKPLVPSKLG
jgi:hypothetical protein